MSYVVLMLCGHCFKDNIMETKDEPNVFLLHTDAWFQWYIASIGKGQKLKTNFGMFCPVKLR
jgi:hypothetical protein